MAHRKAKEGFRLQLTVLKLVPPSLAELRPRIELLICLGVDPVEVAQETVNPGYLQDAPYYLGVAFITAKRLLTQRFPSSHPGLHEGERGPDEFTTVVFCPAAKLWVFESLTLPRLLFATV